jgi:hypothetical protein
MEGLNEQTVRINHRWIRIDGHNVHDTRVVQFASSCSLCRLLEANLLDDGRLLETGARSLRTGVLNEEYLVCWRIPIQDE